MPEALSIKFDRFLSFYRVLFVFGGLAGSLFMSPLGAAANVLASEEGGAVKGTGQDAQDQEVSSEEETLPADQSDHKAQIVAFDGAVYRMKKEEASWSQVQQPAEIREGDRVRTGSGASAEIAYDSTLLNLTHLKENTIAEFRSVEPTDVYLEDGSLFNALDGLDAGSAYQVSTPTYVAAVRGTHFDVQYDKVTQQFSAAALSPEEGSGTSKVFVTDPSQGHAAARIELTEGKQIDVPRGQRLAPALVRSAAPQRVQAAHQAFSNFKTRVPRFEDQRKIGREKMEKRREWMAGRKADHPGPSLRPGAGQRSADPSMPDLRQARRDRMHRLMEGQPETPGLDQQIPEARESSREEPRWAREEGQKQRKPSGDSESLKNPGERIREVFREKREFRAGGPGSGREQGTDQNAQRHFQASGIQGPPKRESQGQGGMNAGAAPQGSARMGGERPSEKRKKG